MSAAVDEPGVPIAAVEQATGIARATLRIWERRYGFPQPARDGRGERSYPQEQVGKLRIIAELMARGHRPGRLVQLTIVQLAALSGQGEHRHGRPGRAHADDPVLGPVRDHDFRLLLQMLQDEVRSLGPAGFVTERMPQMNFNVGVAWARGELHVYEEHLYSEAIQQVLRAEILARAGTAVLPAPRVLLATLPDEAHGLGLLMAQCLLALERCPCTSLGVRVPIAQVLAAAAALRVDIIGLSFTGSMNPARVLRGLEQLRGSLPREQLLWVGGSSPVLARHRVPGVQTVAHIRDTGSALAQWRARRALSA